MRVDILVKNKDHIVLIEVKSKSFDPKESFVSKKGTPNSTWKSYLYDIAFQKYVASQALAGKFDFCITDACRQNGLLSFRRLKSEISPGSGIMDARK